MEAVIKELSILKTEELFMSDDLKLGIKTYNNGAFLLGVNLNISKPEKYLCIYLGPLTMIMGWFYN